ncbi:hypothetical protein Taro_020142 [Colocasia esculenta]|uniref:Uncharacterized protein n=1 Tax=Colocasia esculenta TaxID=4460 RepID=A0A843UVH7_COLES|nr:hypothetical protein [Colocasia esculenta]
MAMTDGANALFTLVERVAHKMKCLSVMVCVSPSVVVRHLFRNASLVGYPRFCVSQARVFFVLEVCPGTCVVPSRSVSSVLDTLTLVFELYVQLRERRQRAATVVELVLRLVT